VSAPSIVTILALVTLWPARAAAQKGNDGGSPATEQLIQDLKNNWGEVKNRLGQVPDIHFTCETRQTNLLKGDGKQAEGGEVIKHFFKKSGKWLVYAHERSGEPIPVPGRRLPTDSFAFGVNSKYSFTLSKRLSQPDWVLKGSRMTDAAPDPKVDVKKLEQYGRRIGRLTSTHLVDHFSVYAKRLTDLLKNKQITIQSITQPEAGGRYVKVAFVPAGAEKALSGDPDWAILDREALYCVRESRATELWPESVRCVFTTKYNYEMSEGFPWLKDYTEHVEVIAPSGKLADYENKKVIRVVSRKPIRETECTLTAFGLPEPVGVTWPKRTPVYVWILLGGGACLVLALGLRYVARRAARKSTPQSI
jgi:hypothetical protein